jgi:hypothetical protein
MSGSRRSAYHEAGHVVAYLHFGVVPRAVYISDGRTPIVDFDGVTQTSYRHGLVQESRGTALPAFRSAVIYLAGPVCEAKGSHVGLAHVLEAEELGDVDLAVYQIELIAAGRMLDPWFGRGLISAIKIIRAHWPLAELVARALLNKGQLTGDELVRISRGL